MTPERFTQLLGSYGGELPRWPELLQKEARNCLAKNPHLRTALLQATRLDQTLEQWPAPVFAGLERRLLQQDLPDRHKGLIDRMAAWLIPSSGTPVSWWRPTALACLPLLMGLVTGGQFELIDPGQGLLFEPPQQSIELSLEEELYFISLSDYAESL